MRRRRIWLGLVASMLVALTPLAAYAAVAQPFSASGNLAQTSAGSSVGAPFSNVEPYLPPALFALVASQLPFNEATPGLMTTGQVFAGSFDESKWGAVKKANVGVAHNSWFTADIGSLCQAPGDPAGCSLATPLFGVAWGGFNLTHGNGNRLSGGYVAQISGELSVAPGCPLGLAVAVTDAGGWELVPGSTHGSFKQIDDSGTIVVNANGCLGAESAQLVVSGTRSGG